MKNTKIILSLFLVIFYSKVSYGEAITRSLPTDLRAKIVSFNPNQIYPITTSYFVSTDIIFGEDETINNSDIHLGDASSWDVDASRNHLYIKAKKLNAGGNMTVVTSKYSYHFILKVNDSHTNTNTQALFLKFAYPNRTNDEKKLALQMVTLPQDICVNSHKYNLKYSFTGDKDLAPILACDDGLFTYFRFRKTVDLPAIFMVLPDRSEEVVNYRVEGNYVVVERTAKAFTLRNGSLVTSVYDDRSIGDWESVRGRR